MLHTSGEWTNEKSQLYEKKMDQPYDTLEGDMYAHPLTVGVL